MSFAPAFFEATAQLIPVFFLAMVVDDRLQPDAEESPGDRVMRSWMLALLVVGEVLSLAVLAGGIHPSKGAGSMVVSSMVLTGFVAAVPVQPDGADVLDANFAALIATLSATLATANETETARRRDRRVEQLIAEFFEAHTDGCIRDQALVLLRRVEAAADDTEVGDIIRAGLATVRRDHELAEEPLKRVANFALFRTELKRLPLLPRLKDQGRMDVADVAGSEGQADALAPTGTPAIVTEIAGADEPAAPKPEQPGADDLPAEDVGQPEDHDLVAAEELGVPAAQE